MKLFLPVGVFALLAVGLLVPTGCGGSTTTTQALTTTTTWPSHTVIIDETADGTAVRLTEGYFLVVRLRGNPSTGYLWQAQPLDILILSQQGDLTFTADSDLSGAGGEYLAVYRAERAGSTLLALDYVGPDRRVDHTFDVEVMVDPAGEATAADATTDAAEASGGEADTGGARTSDGSAEDDSGSADSSEGDSSEGGSGPADSGSSGRSPGTLDRTRDTIGPAMEPRMTRPPTDWEWGSSDAGAFKDVRVGDRIRIVLDIPSSLELVNVQWENTDSTVLSSAGPPTVHRSTYVDRTSKSFEVARAGEGGVIVRGVKADGRVRVIWWINVRATD
jgi:predicted secreted protein